MSMSSAALFHIDIIFALFFLLCLNSSRLPPRNQLEAPMNGWLRPVVCTRLGFVFTLDAVSSPACTAGCVFAAS